MGLIVDVEVRPYQVLKVVQYGRYGVCQLHLPPQNLLFHELLKYVETAHRRSLYYYYSQQ